MLRSPKLWTALILLMHLLLHRLITLLPVDVSASTAGKERTATRKIRNAHIFSSLLFYSLPLRVGLVRLSLDLALRRMKWVVVVVRCDDMIGR